MSSRNHDALFIRLGQRGLDSEVWLNGGKLMSVTGIEIKADVDGLTQATIHLAGVTVQGMAELEQLSVTKR